MRMGWPWGLGRV